MRHEDRHVRANRYYNYAIFINIGFSSETDRVLREKANPTKQGTPYSIAAFMKPHDLAASWHEWQGQWHPDIHITLRNVETGASKPFSITKIIRPIWD